jgi:superfamily II DNA or RNA helicase
MSLHANWDNSGLHVWGDTPEGAPLPIDALRDAIAEASGDALLASVGAPAELRLRLPDETTIPTLRFGAAETIDLLIALCPSTEANTCDGTIRFWAMLARNVTQRIAAQQFFPDLVERRDGELEATWRLLVGTTEEIKRLERFAESMPPASRAIVTNGDAPATDATALVESFLAQTADALIRRDVSHDPFFSRVHELATAEDAPGEVRRMSALLGADRTIKIEDPYDARHLAEQVRSWIGRLEEQSAAAPWQVEFILEEPDEDEDAEGEGSQPWNVVMRLRPPQEDAEPIEASELWDDRADTGAIMGRKLAARREQVRADLVLAAEVFPPLAAILESPAPTNLRLSTPEAHLFIRQWAPQLRDRGFVATLPDWASARDVTPGLLLSISPMDEDVPILMAGSSRSRSGNDGPGGDFTTGHFGLDSLLNFDWQIAVGDLRFSPDEFARLAERRVPLVRYGGRWVQIDVEAADRAARLLEKKAAGTMTLAEAFRTAFTTTAADGVPIVGLRGTSWVGQLLEQAPTAKVESLTQPTAFDGTLRPYQLRGLDWLTFLSRLGIGGCLADDMGLGKAQPLDAKILTPTGWKRMGDIQVGDRVIGSDGKPTRVIGVYPQGKREVFRVTFSDGSATECCDEHLWYVNTPVRKYRGSPGRVLQLSEIRQRLRDGSGNAMHFVPLVEPVQFEASTDLPLQPYLLGVLLGDGGIGHRVTLSSADEEILAAVRDMLPDGLSLVSTGSGVDYRISCGTPGGCNAVTDALRRLELMGCGSHEKFIPHVYKFAPVADRLEMLRGLLDTDGHVRPNDNNVEYCTVSRQLAEDVQFLVQSLGGTAPIREKQTTGRLAYRMSIALPGDVNPFRLPRKADVYHPRAKYPPSRAIVEVTAVGEKDVQCVAVDAPDHLYVTDDFIVTHNTIQLIALLLHEREKRNGAPRLGPTLLFAPTSVVGNWTKELARFAKPLKVLVHHGPERLHGDAFVKAAAEHDVVITSYALAHRDVEDLRRVAWHRLALDEAQKIKNPYAASTQAIRSLAAPQRVALTGTPIENRLSELWSIMEVLNPGLLGSAAEFRDRFAMPIEKLVDQDRAGQLRKLIQPFVLRRTKTDPAIAGDLPEKMEMKVYCNLTPEQAAMYQQITSQMLGQVDAADGIRRRALVLAALTRLKQVCDHPALIAGKDDPNLDGRSGKTERLVEMLEEVIEEGDSALVFSQFREMGHLLEQVLSRRLRIPIPFLHGGTSAKQRDEMIENFQKPGGEPRIFLLSLRAGGLGLNLTNANHVFHFDRWWNPAVESQATDRAHRIGQTRKVQVHKFVCIGTVEERIDQLLSEKVALADRIVGSGDDWLTNLSTEDLRKTLELSASAVAEY